MDAREKYRVVSINRTTPGEELAAAKALFDLAIEDLKHKIRDRYDELSELLEECEKELEIN